MAHIQVKQGDSLEVTVSVEFEGSISSSLFFVDDQFIPAVITSTKREGKQSITLKGKPLRVEIVLASPVSTGADIKKITVTVNGETFTRDKDLDMITKQVRFSLGLSYANFDMEEVAPAIIPNPVIAAHP